MKRVILFTVVLIAVCATGLFGAGQSEESSDVASDNINPSGLPIVNETVTYEIAAVKHDWATKSYNEMEFFKRYEEQTNVHIDWSLSSAEGWQERQTLMFASGDIPDAFYGNNVMAVDTSQYGMAGQLQPIDDLIAKWAPLYTQRLNQYPILRQVSTELDGHIYAFRALYQARRQRVNEGIHVNQVWLDDLGIPVPETTEDFYRMLQKFKDYKENAIPFTFRWSPGVWDMFGSWGFFMSEDFVDVSEDGQLVWLALHPGYKDAISYFHKLFSEDLIDPEVFTHSVNVYRGAKYAANPNYGAFTSYLDVLFLGNWDQNIENDYTRIPPLAGPDGTRMWHEYTSLGAPGFVITSKCEDPEVLVRWIDLSVDPDWSWEANAGMFGQAIEKLPNGKIHQLDPPEGFERNSIRHFDSPGINGYFMLPEEEVEKTEWTALQLSKTAMVDVYEPYFREANYIPDALKFSPEESEQIALMRVELQEFSMSSAVKWMTEGGIESEYDAFVQRLNRMGLEEYMEILNRAYARFLASSE